MPEQITFAAPVEPPKTVFRIARIDFDWRSAVVTIELREWNGGVFGEQTLTAFYTGATATTLMQQLNKLNLSTAGNSLHQRVMTRLLADGKIPAGTASGAAD